MRARGRRQRVSPQPPGTMPSADKAPRHAAATATRPAVRQGRAGCADRRCCQAPVQIQHQGGAPVCLCYADDVVVPHLAPGGGRRRQKVEGSQAGRRAAAHAGSEHAGRGAARRHPPWAPLGSPLRAAATGAPAQGRAVWPGSRPSIATSKEGWRGRDGASRSVEQGHSESAAHRFAGVADEHNVKVKGRR